MDGVREESERIWERNGEFFYDDAPSMDDGVATEYIRRDLFDSLKDSFIEFCNSAHIHNQKLTKNVRELQEKVHEAYGGG